MSGDADPGELLDRLQELTARIDELPDPHARELTEELLGAVIAMYGDGLRRILDAISEARGAGEAILDGLSQDGAVSSLLLIHDLYPVPLEHRVLEALDTVRPYMESHAGNVELLGIENGVARLALHGSCDGCAASRATLELALKQALDEHAPDLAGLEVQGVSEPPAGEAAAGTFELPIAHSAGRGLPLLDQPPARWVPLEATRLAPGELRALEADGVALVLANIDGSLLAYRDRCACCDGPLHSGALAGRILRCESCGADFDLRHAGRAAGGEPLQLTPIPLLEAGGIRVAV